MKIYDCFMFHNELEILKLRFEELYDKVDYFVLVEATKTPSGLDKGLYFQKNKKKFKKYSRKIIHVILKDMPTPKDFNGDRWQVEFFNRNQLIRGLKNCKNDDIILLSDVDEIPNAKKFSEMLGILKIEKAVCFQQKFFYYYLNGFINNDWRGTIACTFENLKKEFSSSPQKLRDFRFGSWGKKDIIESGIWNIYQLGWPFTYISYPHKVIRKIRGPKFEAHFPKVISDGGWHFSCLGGAERIIQKINSFCDKQWDIPDIKNAEKIRERIEKGEDVFKRKQKVAYIALDNSFPKTLLKNRKEYSHLIKKI